MNKFPSNNNTTKSSLYQNNLNATSSFALFTSKPNLFKQLDNFAKRIKCRYLTKTNRSYTDLRFPIKDEIILARTRNGISENLKPCTKSPRDNHGGKSDGWKSASIYNNNNNDNNNQYKGIIFKESRLDIINGPYIGVKSAKTIIEEGKTREQYSPPFLDTNTKNSSLNNLYDNDTIINNLPDSISETQKFAENEKIKDKENEGWFKGLSSKTIRENSDGSSNFDSFNYEYRHAKSDSFQNHVLDPKNVDGSQITSVPSLYLLKSSLAASDNHQTSQTIESKNSFLNPYFLNGHLIRVSNFLYVGDLEAAYCEQVLCKLNIEGLVDVSGMSEKEAGIYLNKKIGWGSTIFKTCTCARETSHVRAKLKVNLLTELAIPPNSTKPFNSNNYNMDNNINDNVNILDRGTTNNKKLNIRNNNHESLEGSQLIGKTQTKGKVPMVDHVSFFEEINKFLDHYRQTGKRILLFCEAGKAGGASTVVVIQYLMRESGLPLRRCYGIIKRLYGDASNIMKLENSLQVALFKYERYLYKISNRTSQLDKYFLYDSLYTTNNTNMKFNNKRQNCNLNPTDNCKDDNNAIENSESYNELDSIAINNNYSSTNKDIPYQHVLKKLDNNTVDANILIDRKTLLQRRITRNAILRGQDIRKRSIMTLEDSGCCFIEEDN
ncbi:unnamed protein product [Gordionus sp. m RMFG-2023]|uniref:integrator complex subunit 5-like protein n=1 Tax=Gordionus sp. m RMFG-2023 TaxID=3053472 RepID=UPI0030E5675A